MTLICCLRLVNMSTAIAAALSVLAAPSNAGEGSCGEWSVVQPALLENADHAIVRDIVAVAPNDAWAVGGWSGYVDGYYQTFAFTMHWDGEAWSQIPTPQPSPCDVCHNVTLWGVDATGPDDVWAAGHKNVQAPDGFVGTHILVMHWDGESWDVLDTPIQTGASGDILWDVVAVAPDDVWFFGENLYADYPLLLDLAIALHWNGSSFEFVDVPIVNFQSSGFGDGNSLRAGSALGPDDIWAVGAGGDGDSLSCDLSQIHHWNGEQWVHVPAQAPDGCFWHDLDAVVAIAPDDVWVGGSTFDGAYHSLLIHWDGSTWATFDAPLGAADFVAFASDDIYGFGSGVMHWDGSSWSVVETFPDVVGPSLAGASAAGPCDIWAGGRLIGDFDQIMPLIVHLSPSTPVNPADLTGDGVVGPADLAELLANWGMCSGCPADLTGDGSVGPADLAELLANWG